jgi:hypothetical protein
VHAPRQLLLSLCFVKLRPSCAYNTCAVSVTRNNKYTAATPAANSMCPACCCKVSCKRTCRQQLPVVVLHSQLLSPLAVCEPQPLLHHQMS